MGQKLPVEIDINARVQAKNRLEEEFVKKEEHWKEQLAKVQGYNATLTDFADSYKNIKPCWNILVRIYIREPRITDSGLFLPSMEAKDNIEIQKRAGSGDRYTQNLIESPFKFATKAVVAAVPEFETKLKTGDTVAIKFVKSIATQFANGDIDITYDGAFVHPDSGLLTPPNDYGNENFGYALLPNSYIEAYIPAG